MTKPPDPHTSIAISDIIAKLSGPRYFLYLIHDADPLLNYDHIRDFALAAAESGAAKFAKDDLNREYLETTTPHKIIDSFQEHFWL